MSDEQRSARLGDHDISKDQSEQLRARELDGVFCEHVGQLPAKAWAALLLNNAAANPQTLANILSLREDGALARDRVDAVVQAIAGRSVSREELSEYCSNRNLAPADIGGLEEVINSIVAERLSFVQERGMGAMGPLMGVVMQAAGGADGKEVSALLRPPFNPSWSEGVMKRRAIVALCVVLMTVHVPSGGAEPLELVWEHDLGPGLITTSPLVDGDHLYVRTSKSWSGEDRPQVHAFTLDGEPVWNRTSTTTQHDMSPLRLTSAGSGPCGSWPSLLLVGWANGEFTALHPENGTVFWSVSSEVRGGASREQRWWTAIHVVVPTRTGLMRLCLADGSVDFVVELSLGWRNGVTKHSGGWVGSETGTL